MTFVSKHNEQLRAGECEIAEQIGTATAFPDSALTVSEVGNIVAVPVFSNFRYWWNDA
jgi:hypothetical protein